MGGEEESSALHRHMTALRLVHGRVRPPSERLHDVIHVGGVQPDLQDRPMKGVHQDLVQPNGEGAGLLVGGEEGAGEADAGNGGARGDHDPGVRVGGEVGAAQATGAGIAPSAQGSAASLGLVDQRGRQRHVGSNAKEQW